MNLLFENKLGGYIAYAIGEILLVVIGILLALQINNWNEGVKDKRLEATYYCKFLEDINQDQRLLDTLILENKGRLRSNNRLIHLLQQEQALKSDVNNALRACIAKIRFRFRPSTSAFDDLKSSGKLAIITNISLKNELLKYYANMEGLGDICDIVADASLEVYNDPTKDFRELGFQDIDFVRSELDSTVVNLQMLQSDPLLSTKARDQFMSDAVFHFKTNARKKELYETMQGEITRMKERLILQCATYQ